MNNPGHTCQDVWKCIGASFKGCDIVVELGAGRCDKICAVKAQMRCAIEIDRASLSRAIPTLDVVRLHYDMRNIRHLFLDKSIDGILIVDALEHVEKSEGYRLLRDCEFIARKEIVLWVPEGKHPQDSINGNPWQAHRATWSRMDLRALGYDVAVWANYHKKPYGARNAMFCVKTEISK